MSRNDTQILVADLGGTHLSLAVMTHQGGDRFSPVIHETRRSRDIKDFVGRYSDFLNNANRTLSSRIRRACICFAGPVDRDRTRAFGTNLGWGFTAQEIFAATGLEELTLLNDFEAVGFGVEVLLANHPRAFVRLSKRGGLPSPVGKKNTAVVIGAGTGLGTVILVGDPATGRYRPVPGEGGHTDFVAVEPEEFRIMEWVRREVNRSPSLPVDYEKIVSGPGLTNLYRAVCELYPDLADGPINREVLGSDPYDRPERIIRHARTDPGCRKALDIWIRAYARAAKNCALFPLAPGGVFLAGGIAARILDTMKSGEFMNEFVRCDVANIKGILERTPVFVITDYRIGLYGCANVAVNFRPELGHTRPKRKTRRPR